MVDSERVKVWTQEGNDRLFRATKMFTGRPKFSSDKNNSGLIFSAFCDKNEVYARTSHNPELVLGEVLPWDVVRDDRCLYGLIAEYSLSGGKPTYLTQYDGHDVRFHRHKQTIDEKRDVNRQEIRHGINSFVERAFASFTEFNAKRHKTEYIPRLVLYDATGQLNLIGFMANRTPALEIPEMAKLREEQKLLNNPDRDCITVEFAK